MGALNGLFSLNIAFAITSLLFIYDNAHHLADAPTIIRVWLEGFSRMLARIAPVAIHWHTKAELSRSAVIRDAIFLGITLGIALLLYCAIRVLTRSTGIRTFFIPLSGIAAFCAVPTFWLYIVHSTWSTYEPKSFGSTYGYVALAELILVGALVYALRNQPIWRGTLLFGVHYVFWMLLMLRHSFAPLVGLPLSLVFPAAGVAWLRCLPAKQSGIAENASTR